jgi:hypothetical protein
MSVCVVVQAQGGRGKMGSAIVRAVETVPWKHSSRLVWLGGGKVMLSAHVCMACCGVAAIWARHVALAGILIS